MNHESEKLPESIITQYNEKNYIEKFAIESDYHRNKFKKALKSS